MSDVTPHLNLLVGIVCLLVVAYLFAAGVGVVGVALYVAGRRTDGS